MSNKINSKDIINKQKEKFSSSKWSKFLTEEFDKPTFEKLLDKLIAEVSKGKQFTPPMKNWFNDFSSIDPDNLKVVIIGRENPLSVFTNTPEFQSMENLVEQGVMFYALGRTTIEKDILVEEWRMFNIYFIDYLLANKKDLVYVFVGMDAAEYSDMITLEEYGNKVFLPDVNSNIWSTDTVHKLFSENINTLLTNKEIDTINW